jgi:dihydropteroate synthase
VEHNVEVLKHLDAVSFDGLPVLVGMSRKSMLGALTGRPVGQRVVSSVAAALLAAQKGAQVLRVHDVAETRDALTVWQALSDVSQGMTVSSFPVDEVQELRECVTKSGEK